MSAKAVAYPAPDKNSTTCTTKIDLQTKLRKKLGRTAEKNTLSGISARSSLVPNEITSV